MDIAVAAFFVSLGDVAREMITDRPFLSLLSSQFSVFSHVASLFSDESR